MWPILRVITRGFDFLLAPFGSMHPGVGLLVVSVITGVVMLFIFGKTSNQKMIAAAKNKLWAYIMEMWLFRNDPRVMFSAIGSVARSNLTYLRHSLRPIVFLIVPVLIIMVQLGIRYAHTPLSAGEETIVSVQFADGVRPSEVDIELVAPEGARVVSAPLRIDATGEIEWRIAVDDGCGTDEILFHTPDGDVTKRIAGCGKDRIVTVGAIKARANTWNAFLYPAEPPLPRDSIIETISIKYPARDDLLFGLNVHWLIIFFIVSVVAGFGLKGVFGIEV